MRYSERDLAALRWAGEQFAVRLDTLQVLLGRDAQGPTKVVGVLQETGVRRVVERWVGEELARSRKLFYKQPAWVWLTRSGLAQVDLPFAVWTPTVSLLNHIHAVNSVRLRIEQQYPRGQWQSERYLRRLHAKQSGGHIPDGEFALEGRTYAVEVELSLKSQARTAAILAQLKQQVDGVWYFVTPQTRALLEPLVGESKTIKLYDIARVLGLPQGERM